MSGQREVDPGLPEGATAGISEMAGRSTPDPVDVVAAGPAALAAGLRLSIAQQGDAPVVALTGDAAGVDPDTAAATGSSIAAVDGVLVPAERRDLDGVFEVHSVQVMGVNNVLRNDAYSMRCKRHLEGAASVRRASERGDGR